MARLNGLQKKLCAVDNPFLVKLERQLVKKLNLVLAQEECLCKQKSRCDWLKENIKTQGFFHLTTPVKRKMNKVELLENNDGIWIFDKETLKRMAVDYLCQWFSAENISYDKVYLPNLSLSEKWMNDFCVEVLMS